MRSFTTMQQKVDEVAERILRKLGSNRKAASVLVTEVAEIKELALLTAAKRLLTCS